MPISKLKQPSAVNPNIHPILHSFFDMYQLTSCEETIWNLLTAYVGQDDADLEPGIDRSNTVYFCRKVNKLIKELHEVWVSYAKVSATEGPQH